MGNQQLPLKQLPSQPSLKQKKSTDAASPSTKTSFFYVKPLKLQNQDFPEEQFFDEDIDQSKIMKELEDSKAQTSEQYTKELHHIEEIKVKWNSFIKMKNTNFLKDYEIKKKIGKGGFGVVYKVKSIYTKIERAAKKIKKTQMKATQHEKLFAQMAILKSLDHPNIAKLYEVYDYKDNYILIMEICQGGQLFKRIVTRQISEAQAADITKQVIGALIYLHKKGIVHRDLKPQNMLFEKDTDVLKIIDFGIACKKQRRQILKSRLGTAYYIAPEVLCKNYNQKCDIWSMGVIIFMMIFHRPPFTGETEIDIMDGILRQQIQFKGKQWINTSNECKLFLTSILKKNPAERPSALEAYNSDWINSVSSKAVSRVKFNQALTKIQKFGFRNKLEAVVYTYIVSQLLSSDEKTQLCEIFREIDINKDGVISKKQLKKQIYEKINFIPERFQMLVRMMDLDGSGDIQFTEFLVASINPSENLTTSHYQRAFEYFDIDHSGQITYEQIAEFLDDKEQSEDSIRQIFKEVDINGDGVISKQQFIKLFVKEVKNKITKSRQLIEVNRQNLTNGSEFQIRKLETIKDLNNTNVMSVQPFSHEKSSLKISKIQ